MRLLLSQIGAAGRVVCSAKILCRGEPWKKRSRNPDQAESMILNQLEVVGSSARHGNREACDHVPRVLAGRLGANNIANGLFPRRITPHCGAPQPHRPETGWAADRALERT